MFNKDVTYCSNMQCPYKDCEHHQVLLVKLAETVPNDYMVSISDFSGICRRYLYGLIEDINENNT